MGRILVITSRDQRHKVLCDVSDLLHSFSRQEQVGTFREKE